jgi:hypothetical protein
MNCRHGEHRRWTDPCQTGNGINQVHGVAPSGQFLERGGDGAEQAVTLVGQQIEEGKGIGVGWGGGGGDIPRL